MPTSRSAIKASVSYLIRSNPTLLQASARCLPLRWRKPTRADWNREYAEGRWDAFDSARESARYRVIAGLYANLARRHRVLEVGCGSGTLLRHLKREGYGSYTGIDVSEVALAKADALADDRTELLLCDALHFRADEHYDVIIFNEILQYFMPYASIVDHYAPMLARGGSLVISLYYETLREEIERRQQFALLAASFVVEEEVEIKFKDHGASIIKVLRARGSSAHA